MREKIVSYKSTKDKIENVFKKFKAHSPIGGELLVV